MNNGNKFIYRVEVYSMIKRKLFYMFIWYCKASPTMMVAEVIFFYVFAGAIRTIRLYPNVSVVVPRSSI
jgi:hypothetical protein